MSADARQLDPRGFAGGRPPVVLLLGGLNLLRPLGLASIPVIVADPHRNSLSLSSRYCRGHLLLPDSREPDSRTAEALMEAGARLTAEVGGRIPLFYGSDDTLNFLYHYREDLSKHYLFLLNEPELARALIQKDEFESLTRAKGLPVPRILSWDDGAGDPVARADFALLVKPKRKIEWHHSQVFRALFEEKGKARIFRDGKDLLSDPAVSSYKEDLIVQEYIPGGDEQIYSFHGFAGRDSEVLASFCGRKIRTYPRLVGESCFLELIKDDALTETGKRIIRSLRFKGVFKIDLKKDPRNGTLYMLEINARFNLWHYLGAVSGVNLPEVAYRYLVDGSIPPAGDYTTRYKWLDLYLDRKAYLELRERREITMSEWLKSLLLARKIYSTFAWTDPAPALRWWEGAFRDKLLPGRP